MEIEDALRRCGGAARWSTLRAQGVTEHALKAGLASGRVKAAGRGGYALLDAEPALTAAVPLCGVVSHASAAQLHAFDLYMPPRMIEMTVGRGAGSGRTASASTPLTWRRTTWRSTSR